MVVMPKSSEAQGHKRQMCRTCRYSHSHLNLTNHFLRTRCVNLKPSCLDSRSAAANSRSVGLTGKLLTILSFLAEEWNHQFFEANPSRQCDEKPEHDEDHDCRSFVWLLGKWW